MSAKADEKTTEIPARPTSQPASLAALPPGASFYGRASASLVNLGLGAVPAAEKADAEQMLAEIFGTKLDGPDAAAKALEIDTARPIWIAVVGPPRPGVEKLLDELVAVTQDEQREQVSKKLELIEPPPHSYVRAIVPLAGDNADKLIAVLEKVTEVKATRCASGCKPFDKSPTATLIGDPFAAAFYVVGRTLTIDVVVGATDPKSERTLKGLNDFHARTGGPGKTASGLARCALLEQHKASALCIDPHATAEAGVASGMMMVMGAVSGTGLDLEQTVRIAKAGKAEALQAEALLAQKPGVLDDGTLSLDGDAKALDVRGSWHVNESGKKMLVAFEKQTCASSSTEVKALLGEVQKAFGVIKADATKQWERFQEAGWVAYPITLGATWPTLLPFLVEGIDDAGGALGKTCVKLDGDRLIVESRLGLDKIAAQKQ